MTADSTALVPASVSPLAPVAADRHPVVVYLARLSVRSRRPTLGALNTLARIIGGSDGRADMMPWHRIEYQHAQAIRTELAERYAPATANRMLAALRGVLKECWRLGLMDAETYHRVTDVEGVRGSTLLKGRALTGGELRALFATCAASDGPAGVRDAALLATLYAGGLRRSEVVALDVADYEPENGPVTIRHGKGNKARIVYLEPGARTAVDRWIEVRGTEPGALFIRIRRGGRMVHTRLTDQAVLDILQRRCAEAGVRECSPHDLRRSMISDLLDAGADISTVQKLAGHANVTTTQRYDRRGEAAKQRAAQLLHVPYGQREFGR